MIGARVASYSGLVLIYCDPRYWSMNYEARLSAMSPASSGIIVAVAERTIAAAMTSSALPGQAVVATNSVSSVFKAARFNGLTRWESKPASAD